MNLGEGQWPLLQRRTVPATGVTTGGRRWAHPSANPQTHRRAEVGSPYLGCTVGLGIGRNSKSLGLVCLCKGKGKGRALVVAPLCGHCHRGGAQVHGAHQAASHIPALYLPSRSRYSFTDPERMEG